MFFGAQIHFWVGFVFIFRWGLYCHQVLRLEFSNARFDIYLNCSFDILIDSMAKLYKEKVESSKGKKCRTEKMPKSKMMLKILPTWLYFVKTHIIESNFNSLLNREDSQKPTSFFILLCNKWKCKFLKWALSSQIMMPPITNSKMVLMLVLHSSNVTASSRTMFFGDIYHSKVIL